MLHLSPARRMITKLLEAGADFFREYNCGSVDDVNHRPVGKPKRKV
jgi:hypothetical protein